MSQVSLQQQIDWVSMQLDGIARAELRYDANYSHRPDVQTLEAILATLVGYQAAQQAKVPR